VKYAILEDNGKLSVFLKAEKSPPTGEDFHLKPVDGGIAHEIIIDGEVVEENLTLMGKDNKWLSKQLRKENTAVQSTANTSKHQKQMVTVQPRPKRSGLLSFGICYASRPARNLFT
jgi:uncharacterized membrane protein YcaP (DUF421 family)